MQDEKKNVTLSIDANLLDWVDDNIKAMRFASKSQAVNYALNELKNDDLRYLQDFSPPMPMANLDGWSADFAKDGRHVHKREIGNISLCIETDSTERIFKGIIRDGDYIILVSRRPLTNQWVRQSDIYQETEIPQSIKTKKDLAIYLEDLADKIQILGIKRRDPFPAFNT
ncbi:MAG: ribbon-helix-helix domain-containing protein [Methanotrichaceae archaeon]